MKTLRFYLVCISMLVCVFVIQSCQQELIEPDNHDSKGVEMIFTAVSEGQTKTNRQEDKTVWWSPSEEINVFYGDLTSSKFVSINEEPSPVVQFKGSLDAFCISHICCNRKHSSVFSHYTVCALMKIVVSVRIKRRSVAFGNRPPFIIFP